VEEALNKTMLKLHEWSRVKFGGVNVEIQKLRSQLEELMHMNADRQEIRKITDRMNELLYREEMMWLQRSHLTWLKEGDRNTKYFHSKAIWRASKNKIRKLNDDVGVTHEDLATLQHMATEYFKNVFTIDSILDPSAVIDLLHPHISGDMNESLRAADEEISRYQMLHFR
jgi:hypothetical protein